MLAVHASTVEELLALLKESWNRHDMVTYAAQFAADAVYVNVIGQEWRGHAEIERGHVSMHRSIFKDSKIMRMTNRTQMIAEGVVVAVSEWEMEGSQSDGLIIHHPRQGVMMAVLAEREGRWWIVAAQNTQKTEVKLPIE